MKVTLYVKGVKTTGKKFEEGRWTYRVTLVEPYKVRVDPDYKDAREVRYTYSVLPEDQQKVVETAKTAAQKYGFDLEVIDVAAENLLTGLWQEKVKHISTFPTLVTDGGEKIEGEITEEQIRLLVSKEKQPRK